MTITKPYSIYLTSPVFRSMGQNSLVSKPWRNRINTLFLKLEKGAGLIEAKSRFPTEAELIQDITMGRTSFIGCHLSHPITKTIVEKNNIKAVCTATAGYNHIHQHPGVLITHTPSVLQNAVADYTLSIILSTLNDLSSLNALVWNNQWDRDAKWDMDAFLGRSMTGMTVGIIGLGEIAQTLVAKLASWNLTVLYFSRTRNIEAEARFKNLIYAESIDKVFADSDIVSLHVPLTDQTRNMVDEKLLRLMKPGALLVNTARGEIINFKAILDLLESREISINLAFDVFHPEPILRTMLVRFQNILKERPELRFLFMPHTASADADTRAAMTAMMLGDLLNLVCSNELDDLTKVHLIPEQKRALHNNALFMPRLFS